MKELVNKYVVLCVDMPNNDKPYFFHGKLLKVESKDITIDDVKLGLTVFPRNNIKSIREMNRVDMIQLAEKYERWALRLKFQQADDKVKKRFIELTDALKNFMK